MTPKRDEFDDMMQNYNNNGSFPNTKTECLSPASTKSESVDSKVFGSRRRLKSERSPSLSNRSATVSNRSNRRGDVRGIIAPSTKDRQLMRQVSGLGLDDFGEKEEAGVQEGVILEGGKVGGVIAPTKLQRQLMRQVSGLGMGDPVFGKHLGLDDSIRKEHASFIFDDMDINDIPEDMRDMVSLASDHTDIVETDDGQSYDSKSLASLAPLGLLETGSVDAILPTTKKNIRRGKKPRPKSKERSTSQSNTSEPLYVPPPAVFGTKSKRRASNDSERQRRGSSGFGSSIYAERRGSNGSTLAAQVDAILSMNDSKAGSMHSRSSLPGHGSRHSRTSHNGHPGPNGLLRGKRPTKPKRQDSRSVSVTSNTYVHVPTTLHKDGSSQRGERYLPESMDEIYPSSKKSSDRREKKKKSITDEKKKKKKSKSRPYKSKSLPSQL